LVFLVIYDFLVQRSTIALKSVILHFVWFKGKSETATKKNYGKMQQTKASSSKKKLHKSKDMDEVL